MEIKLIAAHNACMADHKNKKGHWLIHSFMESTNSTTLELLQQNTCMAKTLILNDEIQKWATRQGKERRRGINYLDWFLTLSSMGVIPSRPKLTNYYILYDCSEWAEWVSWASSLEEGYHRLLLLQFHDDDNIDTMGAWWVWSSVGRI